MKNKGRETEKWTNHGEYATKFPSQSAKLLSVCRAPQSVPFNTPTRLAAHSNKTHGPRKHLVLVACKCLCQRVCHHVLSWAIHLLDFARFNFLTNEVVFH